MPTSENSLQHDEKERGPFSMKDIRSTVMQLSGRWGNTCYATLCLAVEAALDLPYGDEFSRLACGAGSNADAGEQPAHAKHCAKPSILRRP